MRFRRRALGQDGKWSQSDECRLPAHTVFVAAGTQPNTVLAREDAAHFPLDGKYFGASDETGAPIKPQPSRRAARTARTPGGRTVRELFR